MVEHVTDRAVMYVRMSTERQDYSTDHQRASIREYAEARGMPVIREYVDDGKSGLDIKGRAGLSALIRDVQSATPDFSHIIVYDISRWGASKTSMRLHIMSIPAAALELRWSTVARGSLTTAGFTHRY